MKKLYGPYKRKDNRQHVIVVNEDGSRKTISYPKYLMEQTLNRVLVQDETVDHKDGDFNNNNPLNLQILSRASNAAKNFDDHPERRAKKVTLICVVCQKEFLRFERVYNRSLRRNSLGPFCSRQCQGKFIN